MSVQFGRWNFDGKPVAPEYVERVNASLAPYGPDGKQMYWKEGVAILFHSFHTTKESRRETQPHVLPSGSVISWDGRLDNRKGLLSQLRDSLTADSTDVAIAAAAYDRWGQDCFGKLIGDWALSIWSPVSRTLLLAKDPIGTKHLYYWLDDEQITWSTILDPIVRFAGKNFTLNKEYIAGWLSTSPAVHLTPCVGIHSLPPSSAALLRPGKHTVSKYWDFDPGKRIRYRTDAEYEEHFRALFTQAVERKLRSDAPVLSELSGGRDSSSIVCMADVAIARSQAECPRLDTISYFDDSEPNWNERPYFEKVEKKRGRPGWHIDVNAPEPKQSFEPQQPSSQSLGKRFVATPGYDGRTSPHVAKCFAAQGNRVLLSGIGGDEVMGGVPTPAPELEDLLARARFREFAHQVKLWALELRKPWIHLFWEAARNFLPLALVGVPEHCRPAPWLQPSFVKRYRAALMGYPSRTKLFGPLPTFQACIATLNVLQKQLARTALPFAPTYERRYPFLDRDLLEFLFAIPREQLVRPHQRRSLMRRALAGIVPEEILNRKTKGFVSRRPMVAVSQDSADLTESAQDMLSVSLGIVDSQRLLDTLQKARRGEEIQTVTVRSTMCIEGWLKDLFALGCIDSGSAVNPLVPLGEPVRS